LTRWDDDFEKHPVRLRLNQIRDLLDQIGEAEDPGTEAELQRLRDVLSYTRTAIDRADPHLVPRTLLDQADQHATNLFNSAAAFRDSRDRDHLVNANAQADVLLETMARWPVIREPVDIDDVRDRITRFRRSAGQLLQQLRQDANETRAALDSVRAEIERLREQAAADAESARQAGEDRLGAIEGRLQELTATIDSQKGRLDEAIEQYQRQFSESEQTRAQRFEEFADKQREEGRSYLSQLEADGQAGLESIKNDAEEALAAIRKQEEDARTLVAALGAVGASGGYGTYAEQQRRAANFWRWVVVAALGVVGIGAILFVATLPSGEVNWQRYTAKVLISVPLFAIAGYAATQSNKHRRAERQARKAELELAALEPYLSLLPPEKRDEIKTQVALRFFGQPLQEEEEGAYPGIGAPQVWDLLQKLVLKR
jgi:gas vesicle protein